MKNAKNITITTSIEDYNPIICDTNLRFNCLPSIKSEVVTSIKITKHI